MCGICGIVGKAANLDRTRETLGHMLDVMRHRGPDGEGLHLEDQAAFGHARLSIIDVEFGAQPMSNEDRTLTIVYNGEVYNYVELRKTLVEQGHSFRTRSDTEVILHCYEEFGENCVDHFNGMFAFAIWDRPRRKLFLARDRLGIKPFYYVVRDENLVFASEIKALLKVPFLSFGPDTASVAEYMLRSYVTGEGTFVSGVRKLMPGHVLTFAEGAVRKRKYWDVRLGEEEDRGEKHYVEALSALISDSVRLRLRSDVPLGAYLSGGIDSSTVVATACRELGAPLATFSGAFAEGPRYDERRYIDLVVRACKTVHHEVVPSAAEFFEKLPLLVWYLDEPVVGSGVFPQYVVSRMASEHVKVVLGGQGGDELFAGYTKYYRPYFLARFRDCAEFKFHRGAPGTLVQDFLKFVVNRGSTDVPLFLKRLAAPAPASVLSPELGRLAAELAPPPVPAGLSAFEKMLYRDLKEYLQGLLHVEDRASMAASIESRVPLLDYRIVELASSVPYKHKMRNGLTKHLLRLAARDKVPETILERRDKMGFPTPVDVWFRQTGPALLKFFGSDEVARRGVLNASGAARVVRQHVEGSRDNSPLIWRMLNVEIWHAIFMEGKSVESIDYFRK